jgi:hypothetical protein
MKWTGGKMILFVVVFMNSDDIVAICFLKQNKIRENKKKVFYLILFFERRYYLFIASLEIFSSYHVNLFVRKNPVKKKMMFFAVFLLSDIYQKNIYIYLTVLEIVYCSLNTSYPLFSFLWIWCI